MRAAGILSALVLLGVACSEDKPANGDNGEGDADETGGIDVGEGDEGPADAGSRMDARIDATLPPPPAADAGDATVVLPPVTFPDGGLPPVAVPDAAVINSALTPLPHDGDKGSICYMNADCNGDDLGCLLPPGTAIPGVCVEDCQQDSDCGELDGIKGVCNAPFLGTGLCEYPCGGPQNDGKGKCPADMVCENRVPTNPIFPDWRCRYPAGGGKKTEKPFTKCDTAHQGGDCEGLSWCVQPALSAVSAVLPHGYCSPVCTKDADCKGADEGTSARGFCNILNGTCEYDCSNPGARCPLGMNCLDIDQSQAIFTLRCVFVD